MSISHSFQRELALLVEKTIEINVLKDFLTAGGNKRNG